MDRKINQYNFKERIMKRTKDIYLQYQVESLERRMNLLRDMQMEILDERVPKRVKEVLINQILEDENIR
jgi:hypothetical protein